VKMIAHRGNLRGPNPDQENKPEYIEAALAEHYDVEVDVWRSENKWYLGHDEPQYEIDSEFLVNERIWCHAKNLHAFQDLLVLDAHCFWHQKDDYTLTSSNFIWAYPGQPLSPMSICVMPELTAYTTTDVLRCAGICSDWIEKFGEIL